MGEASISAGRHVPAHVVVVGGGFAGVACAKRLAGEPRARVTVLDRTGQHQFQPLLYQVATAELTADDIQFDLAEMFARHDNVEARAGEVVELDPTTPSVTLADGSTLDADVLVLAAGATPNFFRTPGAEQHSLPLYSLADAERIRARLLELFREAAAKPELIDEGALTFVVVGGGPTGVEIAGAVAELAHDVMPHVHPELSSARPTVILVDIGPTVLGPFATETHEYAARQLHRRGVELRLGTAVKEVAPDRVVLGDGTSILTRLTIWGGGEQAVPLAARSGLPQGRGGRIEVDADLSVPGFPAVYALGDVANYVPANPLQTPQHIVPEWYLLPFYAILRAVPNKLMGVIAMGGAIATLFVLPWLDTSKVRSMRYRPTIRLWFFIFILDCVILGICGAHAPDDLVIPGVSGLQLLDADLNSYVWLSRIAALYYFVYFWVITPLMGLTETPLPVPESISAPVLSHPASAPTGAVASPEKRG